MAHVTDLHKTTPNAEVGGENQYRFGKINDCISIHPSCCEHCELI